jgi:hypothetical protein
LSGFEAQAPEAKGLGWFGSEISVILLFRVDVNGAVIVDIVDQPWPDCHMPSATSTRRANAFGSLGDSPTIFRAPTLKEGFPSTFGATLAMLI